MSALRVGSMFAGYDGIGLGLDLLWPDQLERAWFVEFDPAPSKVLAHHWPDVPNYGDITTVDWAAVEPVDVLTGGYPCQPFSVAGNRNGTDDPRHLWPCFARAIRILRPRLVVAENVRGHLGLGFDAVLADLAAIGFDAEWVVVRASDVGAPHRRERLFIVAHPSDADLTGLEWTQPERARGWDGPAGGAGALTLLPTPVVTDSAGARNATSGRQDGSQHHSGTTLGDLVHLNAFGVYAPAIARWETILDRPAPEPTIPAPKGGRRLSPVFVEWLMGLPGGHVTDPAIGLTRAQQIKALGNGVVPQQAALALRMLLGLGGTSASSDGLLLRTPTAQLAVNGGSQHPDKRKAGGHGPTLADEVEHLLPTPAVNDMGAGKTPPPVGRVDGAHET